MNRKIRTWVEISLNDLEHNYREISSRLPDGCQMLSGWPSIAMTGLRSCAPPA